MNDTRINPQLTAEQRRAFSLYNKVFNGINDMSIGELRAALVALGVNNPDGALYDYKIPAEIGPRWYEAQAQALAPFLA